MRLSQIGEFGLIDLLKNDLASADRRLATVIGIGDDAAVLKPAKDYQLITTDALIENVHFKGKLSEKLGQKAMLVNVSDIIAMGGEPTAAVVTIGLKAKTTVAEVKALYRGLKQVAKKYHLAIVGGDTISSPRALMISITLLGRVKKKHLLLRSGARAGDLICVTGSFGGPMARHYGQKTPTPVLRTQLAKKLAKMQLATSLIDSSDGLVRSVIELCRASKTGARIWEALVPLAKGATLQQALFGGEEYELVFTIRGSERGIRGLSQLGKEVKIIGKMINKSAGIRLVGRDGNIKPLPSGGYEHFKV
ncbi:thiamine-phosphate kinase [candidate division WOR-1 bacterium RIFOXYB2_FULL_48_7]|uniref:Thiamine-monophosphate kinase n=1 Tax=candidate division WOR-1 bacterium RIFOXYB2_FULL_48_7 TaxID=1802583 RepID=A0A1F4TLF9_UNCSA|nr:MAG: thiamine-phosphate kinase [candidate division WOR-1 bacterium RIFOXYB2_FULL_48_7]